MRKAESHTSIKRNESEIFLSEFSEGFIEPLSLSIPKVKREKLKPLLVKTKLYGTAYDQRKLFGDMSRAMEHVFKTTK